MADYDRPLAARGWLNATDQGRQLPPGAGHHMLASSAVRTTQTAEALRSAWASADIPDLPELTTTKTGYLASAEQWLALITIHAAKETSTLWIIGHNPGISSLVQLLSGAYIGMATADIVRIELDIPSWQDLAPGTGTCLEHRPGRGA